MMTPRHNVYFRRVFCCYFILEFLANSSELLGIDQWVDSISRCYKGMKTTLGNLVDAKSYATRNWKIQVKKELKSQLHALQA